MLKSLNEENFDIKQIKVVTVMPCYDKKLEAVRPDLQIPPAFKNKNQINEQKSAVKEIDTVLATHELVDLF